MSLKSASKKNEAPIWLAIAKMLGRPGSRRVEVNLGKIARKTEKGSVVVVPGKVLGSGNIDHKITLCAFSLSQGAAKKVIDAGGKVMSIRDCVEKFPDGSGVSIIV
ncbi:MAG: 50S ribosomal protein L18e [Nitrososphaerales archaeon]